MRFYQFVWKNVWRRRAFGTDIDRHGDGSWHVCGLRGHVRRIQKSFLAMYQNRGVDLIVSFAGPNQFSGTMPEGVPGTSPTCPTLPRRRRG